MLNLLDNFINALRTAPPGVEALELGMESFAERIVDLQDVITLSPSS